MPPRLRMAVEVGHGRRRPAHVEILAARPVAAPHAIVDIGADGLVPVAVVRRVDRVFPRLGRNRNGAMGEDEPPRIAVEHEDVRALADCQHEARVGAVEREASGQLIGARL